MIYPAIVLDNSMFLTRGTIRVRVAQYFFGEMQWDLSKSPDFIKLGVNEKNNTHNDFEAYVYSPFGGGEDYGLFSLPQVNTRGLVAFVGNTIERGNVCFWLGSIFQPEFKNNKLDKINFPTDKTNGFSNGFQDGKEAMDKTDLNGAVVLKTKETHYDKADSSDAISKKTNWVISNATNTIVINKDKILIHHSLEYDKDGNETSSEELEMNKFKTSFILKKTDLKNSNKDKTISLTFNKDDSDKLSFNLKCDNKQDKTSNIINSEDNTLTISATKNTTTATTVIEPEDITLTAKGNSVKIDSAGVTLTAETSVVTVNAREVHLGPHAASHVLTTTSEGFFPLSEGLTVEASSVIFG